MKNDRGNRRDQQQRPAHSMMAMNQAARVAFFGVGWVMPKVLMKAFEIKSSGRMVIG